MKIGDYLICKKNYYESSSFFSKPTFVKNKSYRIDNITSPFYTGQGSIGYPTGSQGTPGVPVVSVTTTTPTTPTITPTTITTTTSTTTTTTTTYSTTICNHVSYIINDVYLYEWDVEKYFYNKQEERLIKLKKLKNYEKKI